MGDGCNPESHSERSPAHWRAGMARRVAGAFEAMARAHPECAVHAQDSDRAAGTTPAAGLEAALAADQVTIDAMFTAIVEADAANAGTPNGRLRQVGRRCIGWMVRGYML